jgi:Spy/CpxP family protein refolding chaperone
MTNRRGATRGTAIALLAFVALAGLGVGVALDRTALRPEREGAGDHRPFSGGRDRPPFDGRGGPPSRGREPRGMRDRFAHELDLSPQQSARIDSIMMQQTADFRRIRDEVQPRFDSLLAKAQARIDSVLTSAQREKLKKLRDLEVFGPRGGFGPPDRRPSRF